MSKVRVSLFAICFLGCDSSGGGGARDGSVVNQTGGDGGTEAPFDPSDVGTAAALFSAVCSATARCTTTPFISSQQACTNLLTLFFDCAPGLSSKTVQGVNACRDSLSQVPCNVLARSGFPTPACERAAESLERSLGAVGEGELCEDALCVSSAECTSDGTDCLRCEGSVSREGEDCSLARCEGDLVCNENERCVQRFPDGKACNTEDECESGLCRDRVCVTPKLGDECLDFDCGSALACRNGKCAVLAKPGEPCDEEGQCTFDATCDQGRCTTWAGCGAGSMGTRCFFDSQCNTGLVCGEEGCTTPARRGEDCDEKPCAEGLTCFSDDTSVCDFNEDPPGSCSEEAASSSPAPKRRAQPAKRRRPLGW